MTFVKRIEAVIGVVGFSRGVLLPDPGIVLAGIILFGHSAMDRIFGYGLKYGDDFKHTNLGWIGRKK
ncbi:DUF4260 family protein [Sphingobacterium phlebotomi]|uniref:DUF4260 family protein n=1 Tax=Sphingobacterium phlebotomi TaxID=2605433 RepID=UPI001CA33B9A|nr:DUF4260 family protein [Sphingobacterium phlebotomi]